jgi:hypothetical protein
MQNIYLNDLSFSCTSKQQAIDLFRESFNEVLIILGETPRACFVHRFGSIEDINFGGNISYTEIVDGIKKIDIDTFSTLVEFADKSNEESIDEKLLDYAQNIISPSISNVSTRNSNDMDIILTCSFTHSILMSLNTGAPWDNILITVSHYNDSECSDYNSFEIGNVSSFGHGEAWLRLFLPPESDTLPKFFEPYAIRIFSREHGIPHFHLCFRKDKLASIEIESCVLLNGQVPNAKPAQQALQWAQDNQDILRENWKNLAQPGYIFYG